ncbi:Hypothetical predicted protein [Octopus vulgaris]|uniref:HMG box domain-containing protein n=1 Tax=Octopus vulgaris TaxID=6645 RepID=A0AA36BWW5_OCTVU|nr:Hypothetical predicted protein [Octopus vulgaris]
MKKKFVDSGLLPETSNILSDINEVRNEFSAKQAGIFSSSDILQFSTFETPKKKHDISGKKDQENFTISGSHFQLRQLSCGTSTFTPLKSPPIFDLGLSPITTPCIKQLNNYLPCGLYVPSPDNDANKYLICNENINEIDKVTSRFFTESKQEPTPLPPDNYLNKNTDSLDFDGYFFFYKQIVEEMKHRPYEQRLDDMDIASKVSKMWRGLSAEQKKTLMTLAALEKNDVQCSKLTDDLQNVDVKKVIDIDDIDDAQLFSRNTGNSFQIVPEMNLRHSKDEGFLTTTFPRDVSQNYSHCEVPEYNPCKIFQSPSLTALNWSTNHCTWKANINNQSTNNSSICSSHKMDFDNESELVPTWGEEV